MGLLTIEHSRASYRLDLAFYLIASLLLLVGLMVFGPSGRHVELAAWTLFGLLSWTLIEYLLHRFVLHGLLPFSRWHGAHHLRPMALICSPTLMSAGLIVLLVFTPAWLVGGAWRALALSAGIVTGYTAYTWLHHGTHHWRSRNAWFLARRRSHARHHGLHLQPGSPGGHFGVTTGLWDRAFGT